MLPNSLRRIPSWAEMRLVTIRAVSVCRDSMAFQRFEVTDVGEFPRSEIVA
jgi:hypothetical protein